MFVREFRDELAFSESTKQVEELKLTITRNEWKVQISLESCKARQGLKPPAKWLCSFDPPRFIYMEREVCSFLTYVYDTTFRLH